MCAVFCVGSMLLLVPSNSIKCASKLALTLRMCYIMFSWWGLRLTLKQGWQTHQPAPHRYIQIIMKSFVSRFSRTGLLYRSRKIHFVLSILFATDRYLNTISKEAKKSWSMFTKGLQSCLVDLFCDLPHGFVGVPVSQTLWMTIFIPLHMAPADEPDSQPRSTVCVKVHWSTSFYHLAWDINAMKKDATTSLCIPDSFHSRSNGAACLHCIFLQVYDVFTPVLFCSLCPEPHMSGPRTVLTSN